MFSNPATHLLKVVSLRDDSITVLFDRPGSALWDKTIGAHLAVSPTGNLVAVVTGLRPVQMRSPDAYLQEGTLEIWDIDTEQQVATIPGVADDVLSWFPDGRRLAMTRFIPRANLPAGGNPGDFGNWERVPVVVVWHSELEHTVSVGLHSKSEDSVVVNRTGTVGERIR